jgi:DNA-binding IclR family transcriptional regulator
MVNDSSHPTAHEQTPRDRVKTAETLFDIVETIRELDGGNISEIADELGLANSTVHRHVRTLEDLAYLVNESGEYHIGLKFLGMGVYARHRKSAYKMVKPKIQELAEQTKETVQFVVEEHGDVIYVHRELGERGVKTPKSGVGKRIELHSAAAGKALLAQFPDEQVDRIIEMKGLPELTENTITDRDKLFENLESIRKRGYAFNREENTLGVNAVGAAATDQQANPVGAISISGPAHRMKGDWYEQELPDQLLTVVNEFEINIIYE